MVNSILCDIDDLTDPIDNNLDLGAIAYLVAYLTKVYLHLYIIYLILKINALLSFMNAALHRKESGLDQENNKLSKNINHAGI